MIARLWHGYTRPADADAYERLLRDEIFRGIASRAIPGYRGIELFRRQAGQEVDFVTLKRFDSLDAVRAIAGEDHETAVVPPEAQALLMRYDRRSAHYEVREMETEARTWLGAGR